MSNEEAASPRVFISYAQFSEVHSARVLALAQSLRQQGIDVELDQYHKHELLDCPRWCQEQLRPDRADWVLMVCSATYRDRLENRVDPHIGNGVFWEGTTRRNSPLLQRVVTQPGATRCVHWVA